MASKSQLTQNSWLIANTTNRDLTGILFDRGDRFVFLSPTKRFEFEDLVSASKKLGKLKDVEKLDVDTDDNINGYPVKHDGFILVSEEPPIYQRSSGRVEFIAGWCAIEFEKGWVTALCPKYSTYKDNNHIGPFRNRLECVNQAKIMNTRRINESF